MLTLGTPDYKQTCGKVETTTDQYDRSTSVYVSNSGYTIPVTPKRAPRNKLSENDLREAEESFRKFYKLMQPYFDKGIFAFQQNKAGERSVHLNILTTIPEGAEPGTDVYTPEAPTNTLITFGLQQGNIYNLPYLSLASLPGNFEPDVRDRMYEYNKDGWDPKLLTGVLNNLDLMFEKECKKANIEYTSEVFTNLLFLARNMRWKSLTKDVSYWVAALQEDYTQDELWFALNGKQIETHGGMPVREIVKEYKTYLFLMGKRSIR